MGIDAFNIGIFSIQDDYANEEAETVTVARAKEVIEGSFKLKS